MSLAERKERARRLLDGLRKLYPGAECELDHSNPLELIVGVILSAQCTDARVNQVTKTLFQRYRTARDYADARPEELEAIIRSAGFYRMKARAIRETARALVERHGGEVPDTMEELLALRGVARKTANVVLGTAFGKAEGVVVDTHMKRLAYRMGLTRQTDPVKVERDLMACVPREAWIDFGHFMIWHGRRVCKALSPACSACALAPDCPKRGVPQRFSRPG
ncbi:MAG TPA: endonuclease III [Elusimicrobiota bacterium]|jgi:endonuclease-3|nr:endonuclease III [Elusimicrobiota bacterium]